MRGTFDPALTLPADRARFAVGDTEEPWLLDDATIAAAIRQSAGTWSVVTATSGDADLGLVDHPFAARQTLIVIIGGAGLAADALVTVAATTDDTLTLTTLPDGAAYTPSADAELTLAPIQEDRAARTLAAGLLAHYAHKPSQTSDDGGAQAWAQQIATWRQIASGDQTTPRRATGRRWQRGATPDWTAGEGDA
jgi:hypothetical protein